MSFGKKRSFLSWKLEDGGWKLIKAKKIHSDDNFQPPSSSSQLT
ncbi:hypothetical protein [Chryseobacterium daeguense]|nr:hypothetical protein [Chryseobacterium daeguense]